MTTNDLTDFTVTLKMARKTGSLADEVEHRTFTVTGPARHAKHAEAIAFGLGHGINEATGYAWKFCGGSDGVTVIPAGESVEAELEKVRAQLTAANRRADGLEADLRSAVTANTAWANQGKPCLIVTCLECGEKYEYDGGVVHFSALDEAQSMAEDDDWRRVGDQFVCADCIHKPHTFTPDGLDALTCQRCDLEEDDHETAPAVVTVELPAEAVAR